MLCTHRPPGLYGASPLAKTAAAAGSSHPTTYMADHILKDTTITDLPRQTARLTHQHAVVELARRGKKTREPRDHGHGLTTWILRAAPGNETRAPLSSPLALEGRRELSSGAPGSPCADIPWAMESTSYLRP